MVLWSETCTQSKSRRKESFLPTYRIDKGRGMRRTLGVAALISVVLTGTAQAGGRPDPPPVKKYVPGSTWGRSFFP